MRIFGYYLKNEEIVKKEGLMEIELKYLIESAEKAQRIWRELQLCPIAVKESKKEKQMHAVYFDGADERLAAEGIAVRVRREGDETVATVKWDSFAFGEKKKEKEQISERGALHVRPELNVFVADEAWFSAPPSNLFGKTKIGERISHLMQQEALIPLLETKFLRRLIQLRLIGKEGEETLCEAAVDIGEIVASEKREPICELEIELLSGDEKQLLELGDKIQAAYGLTAGKESKFARGKALRNQRD